MVATERWWVHEPVAVLLKFLQETNEVVVTAGIGHDLAPFMQQSRKLDGRATNVEWFVVILAARLGGQYLHHPCGAAAGRGEEKDVLVVFSYVDVTVRARQQADVISEYRQGESVRELSDWEIILLGRCVGRIAIRPSLYRHWNMVGKPASCNYRLDLIQVYILRRSRQTNAR